MGHSDMVPFKVFYLNILTEEMFMLKLVFTYVKSISLVLLIRISL